MKYCARIKLFVSGETVEDIYSDYENAKKALIAFAYDNDEFIEIDAEYKRIGIIYIIADQKFFSLLEKEPFIVELSNASPR